MYKNIDIFDRKSDEASSLKPYDYPRLTLTHYMAIDQDSQVSNTGPVVAGGSRASVSPVCCFCCQRIEYLNLGFRFLDKVKVAVACKFVSQGHDKKILNRI